MPDHPADPEPSRHGYRPDIEGLRAVAVLAVVAYHADVPGITGGYVGVDAFYVISGFLITGLLWRELSSTGRISLASFYARRARRVLPRRCSSWSPRSSPRSSYYLHCRLGRSPGTASPPRCTFRTIASPARAPTTWPRLPRRRPCCTTGRSRSRSSST